MKIKRFNQINENNSESLIEVEKDKYGQFIKFYVEIEAPVDDKDVEDGYISEEDAIKYAEKKLMMLSGSNDANNLLINSKPIFKNIIDLN